MFVLSGSCLLSTGTGGNAPEELKADLWFTRSRTNCQGQAWRMIYDHTHVNLDEDDDYGDFVGWRCRKWLFSYTIFGQHRGG